MPIKRGKKWYTNVTFKYVDEDGVTRGRRIQRPAGTRKADAEREEVKIRTEIVAGTFKPPPTKTAPAGEHFKSPIPRGPQDAGDEIQKVYADLAELRKQLREMTIRVSTNDYPQVPEPTIRPSYYGEDLPAEPGIYFLWRHDTVEYVGKSVRLSSRVRLGHHILMKSHKISYVLIEREMLDWAEAYYIGILRPFKNFGRSAAHKKAERKRG